MATTSITQAHPSLGRDARKPSHSESGQPSWSVALKTLYLASAAGFPVFVNDSGQGASQVCRENDCENKLGHHEIRAAQGKGPIAHT